ncbi:MAG: arylsulfatase A-like enzyme [Planctomycetota bacterium]|jgi:arylsulfatase A-like enzyme
MGLDSKDRQAVLLVLLCCAPASACGGNDEDAVVEEEVSQVQGPGERPNVLIILADDLGWSDVSMHGSRFHRTPNIDALAAGGVRFSQAYSASPLCSPTRASIMTGQDPARHGVTAPMGHLPEHVLEVALPAATWPDRRAITPTTATRIAFEHETLAEVFREAGYATALFGKWHLGGGPHAPSQHGFETVVGGGPHAGPPSYFSPFDIADLPPAEDGDYLTDVLVDGTVDWLQTEREKPFFACLWFYQVHAPFQAREDLREEAFVRMDPADPQHSPTYAAMVNSMDDGVGRVLETLKSLGLDENTIVVFASDNGGNQYDTIYGDVLDSPRSGVAPTRNLPLRGGKGTLWEGGVRVPLVVSWPRAVKEGRLHAGTVTEALATSTDLYPSLLELAGLPARDEQALDGHSFVPALTGEGVQREEVVVHFPHDFTVSGNRAGISLRRGNHKLMRVWADGVSGADRELLYDLEADGAEANDLADELPRVRAELAMRLDHYLERTGALVPVANPSFDALSEQWMVGEGVSIEYVDGDSGKELHLKGTGEHPWIATPYIGAISGHMTFELEVATTTSGPMELFWAVQSPPGLSRGRSVSVPLEPDGEWHTVRLEFETAGYLAGLRLDPFRGEGEARLRSMKMFNIGGEVVREWRP